ncbi:MAG: ribosome maturation factor RimP [Coriobacteriia bacterium]|nr:ribosome maturation factor RimP [Coriobacteriia bacterium]
MPPKAKLRQLREAIEAAAPEHQMQLVDVELLTISGQPTVRVYIEPDDESGVVTIDALAAANAWVDPLVESVDPFPGAYRLELSSPGIDRILRTKRHFERFCGQTVRLRTEVIDGRSNWTGTLTDVAENSIYIEIDGKNIQIDMDKIKKAHVQTKQFSEGKG